MRASVSAALLKFSSNLMLSASVHAASLQDCSSNQPAVNYTYDFLHVKVVSSNSGITAHLLVVHSKFGITELSLLVNSNCVIIAI